MVVVNNDLPKSLAGIDDLQEWAYVLVDGLGGVLGGVLAGGRGRGWWWWW